MGKLKKESTWFCLQGGGLRINDGTVFLDNCSVYNNRAEIVSDHFKKRLLTLATLFCPKSQRPHGKSLVAQLIIIDLTASPEKKSTQTTKPSQLS